MAGSYPDAPSRRMAWDDDGSLGFYGATAFFSGAQNQALNSEANANVSVGGSNYGIIFPELREVDGWFFLHNGASYTSMATSTDTTNGIDGTWVTQLSSFPGWTASSDVRSNFRVKILSLAVSNVRAVNQYRTGANQGAAMHCYGEITPGQTPDRLLWIDSGTNLEFGLPIDYGDIPRGSASDRLVKLRNNSATFTAATIQVTAEANTLGSGAWYTFSDGAGFQSTLPLASSIGPSSDSPVITIRRDIPDNETVGLHAGRVQVSVGSWS